VQAQMHDVLSTVDAHTVMQGFGEYEQSIALFSKGPTCEFIATLEVPNAKVAS
jgi:hypothetical protein